MNIPSELKYTKDHEWVRIDGDIATIGITDFAQSELGDIVYVEVETVDETLEADRQDANQTLAKELNLKLKMLDEEWKDIRDELHEEISSAKGDSQKFEHELDVIEEQHGAFLDADIDQAKVDLDSLPSWRQDIENLNERHKLQTEKHR